MKNRIFLYKDAHGFYYIGNGKKYSSLYNLSGVPLIGFSLYDQYKKYLKNNI